MTAIERSGSALAARSTSINSLVFRRKSPSAKHRAPTRSFIFFFKYVKGCSSAQLWLQWRERESSEGKIGIYLKTPELPIWIQCLWKLCQFNWEIRSFSNHYNISTPLNFFFLFWELEKQFFLKPEPLIELLKSEKADFWLWFVVSAFSDKSATLVNLIKCYFLSLHHQRGASLQGDDVFGQTLFVGVNFLNIQLFPN